MRIEPGETVELAALEASGGRITRTSNNADVLLLEAAYANPVTGPIWVEGAQPGDALVVDLLEFALSGGGWTAIIPGFGLLAEDFGEPFLHLSAYDSQVVEFTPEIHLPTRPFTGTIGVAPAEAGHHSAIPPRAVGGNLDCRDIVAGARLWLPVAVPGALFSLGDTHAAQGDGEVCGTAIETPLTVRVRIDLIRDAKLRTPRLELPAAAAPPPGSQAVTFGIGPDLHAAARDAVRDMIDLVGAEYGLAPELAYCLCSVAAHLHISEVVNAPNWVVAAYLPRAIFR
jgi:acetamidase/formamidase